MRFFTGFLTGLVVAAIPVAFAAGTFFADVPTNAWYTSAVENMAEKGIMRGDADGTNFQPNRPVNRAELAVTLDRLMQTLEGENFAEDRLCTDTDEPTMGGSQQAVALKYGRLEHLGQLFTAHDCGEPRLRATFGGSNALYTLGVRITLKEAPSSALVATFQDIGFECEEKDCMQWELPKAVLVKELLRLKEFSQEFDWDDCIHCG